MRTRSDSDWQRRVAKMIKAYKPARHDASFRNAYKSVLVDSGVGGHQLELLMRVRGFLEFWVDSKEPDRDLAFSQLRNILETANQDLPRVIAQSLISRFPKFRAGLEDWEPFIRDARDPWLVDALLSTHRIKRKDLILLANRDPAAFFLSPALDVLLKTGGKCPASFWTEVAKSHERPPTLLSYEEVVAKGYFAELGDNKAEDRLLTVLIQARAKQRQILTKLIEHSGAALRFCWFLAHSAYHGRPIGRRVNSAAISDIIEQFREVAELEARETSAYAATASLVSCILRLLEMAKASGPTAAVMPHPGGNTAETAYDRLVVRLLNLAEQHGEAAVAQLAVAVKGDALYRSVQVYLETLTTGSGDDGGTPEHVMRLERNRGRKEVIEQLLRALSEADDDADLRDGVEVTLFNAGVRQMADAGEVATFDLTAHDPEESGILRGERVVVTVPGKQLGEGSDAIVLVKAKVRPFENGNDEM